MSDQIEETQAQDAVEINPENQQQSITYRPMGRRKGAIARIYIKQGSGKLTINKRDAKEYIPVAHLYNRMVEPLLTVQAENMYDINVNVKGGGLKGQAEAIRLGIARVLNNINPEEFHGPLKAKSMLTRDSRVVERKKYGKPKARKSFQFSKR